MRQTLKNILKDNRSLSDRLDRVGIEALEGGEFDIAAVALGMHYALTTGRLGTAQDKALREMSVTELEGLIESLAEKNLQIFDVPRFLNGNAIKL